MDPERIVDNAHVWERIREESAADAAAEPALAGWLNTLILAHGSLGDALSFILASKLESETLNALTLRDLISPVLWEQPHVIDAVLCDLQAVAHRDPACRGYSQPLLYFKGFHALQAYRIAHAYWTAGRQPLALYLQAGSRRCSPSTSIPAPAWARASCSTTPPRW